MLKTSYHNNHAIINIYSYHENKLSFTTRMYALYILDVLIYFQDRKSVEFAWKNCNRLSSVLESQSTHYNILHKEGYFDFKIVKV